MSGNVRSLEDVKTLPSVRVTSVVESVSHEGNTWVGAAMGEVVK